MKKSLPIIERTSTGYSAYVPDLPGCIATGRTKRQIERNIHEAIDFHLKGLKENGIKNPAQKKALLTKAALLDKGVKKNSLTIEDIVKEVRRNRRVKNAL